MAKWTLEEHLTFDIAFALKKITIPGFRKAVTEEHRIAIAKTILIAPTVLAHVDAVIGGGRLDIGEGEIAIASETPST
jgi:hypothetical protein